MKQKGSNAAKEERKLGEDSITLWNTIKLKKKSTRWIKTDLYNWQADKWNMHTHTYKRPGILILPIFYECNL